MCAALVSSHSHAWCSYYFAFEGANWVWKGFVDKPAAAKSGAAKGAGGVSAASAARAMWANKTDLGGEKAGGGKMTSLHQNAISGIQILDAERFSTSAFDGRVVVWDMASLQTAVLA